MEKPVTGKYSVKTYRCTNCKHEHKIGTNHWGETYGRCPNCAWRTPGQIHPQECMEPCPETHDKSEPWKIVRLGDIAKTRHI